MLEQSFQNTKLKPEIREVSVWFIIQFLKRHLLKLAIVTVVTSVLGYVASFLITPTYRAKAILLPEYSSGVTSSFVSLAMGIKAGEGADNLVPELYPNILNSYPFGVYLLKQPVVDRDNISYPTLENYLNRKTAVSFFSNIFSFINKNKQKEFQPVSKLSDPEIMLFSKEQESQVKGASQLAKATLEKASQTITIESEMSDPVIAALVAAAAKKYLVNYVEEYRTQKAEQNANFLEGRTKEAKKRLQSAEYALQSYKDRNRNTFLNVARIEEQHLQSEYILSQSLYSDLVQKLEQARIKVKQEKPVFKVLEPIRVPLITSAPRRLIIAAISGVLAFISMLVYILIFKERLFGHFIEPE